MGQYAHLPCQTNPTQEAMKECLGEASGILDECGIEYALDSGTLLGVYRDRKIPCWTTDVNLTYPQRDAHKLKACLHRNNIAFETNLLSNQFEFCCPTNKTRVKMRGLVSSLSGNYTCDINRNIDYKTSDYFPLQNLGVGDRWYPVPNRTEKVLNKMYWSDWRVASSDPGPGAGCWSIGL